jgi:hypothetical protein
MVPKRVKSPGVAISTGISESGVNMLVNGSSWKIEADFFLKPLKQG